MLKFNTLGNLYEPKPAVKQLSQPLSDKQYVAPFTNELMSTLCIGIRVHVPCDNFATILLTSNAKI